MRLSGRITLAIAIAIAVAIATYALTASNTVPGSNAGIGSGAVSGYTVSSISYTLNGSSPQNIDQVAFTISPSSATTVKAQVTTAGSWYSCVNASGSVTCNTTSPQATVAAADQLTVVATD